MATKAKWPESVPVFTVDMIQKGGGGLGRAGQCCALGHVHRTFPDGGPQARAKAILCEIVGVEESYEIISWNDRHASKVQIANALNETCRRLGYTELTDA